MIIPTDRQPDSEGDKLSQKCIHNRDVRNTLHSSDMVELVARALCDLERPTGTYDHRLDEQGRALWQCDAKAALQTCHHDESLAALNCLVGLERSIKIDVGLAHKARQATVSETTRQVDADFRRELDAAFANASALLAKIGASAYGDTHAVENSEQPTQAVEEEQAQGSKGRAHPDRPEVRGARIDARPEGDAQAESTHSADPVHSSGAIPGSSGGRSSLLGAAPPPNTWWTHNRGGYSVQIADIGDLHVKSPDGANWHPGVAYIRDDVTCVRPQSDFLAKFTQDERLGDEA